MSKIRTPEQLYDILDEQITWRKKELADLKSMVEARSAPERTNCLIRCGITLLYAHWEGFVKEAAEAYLIFINTQRLSYKDLAPNFIALGMRKRLNEAFETNKVSLQKDLVTFFLSGMEERCTFVPEISTQSNLSSQVLKEIISILGLDFSIYEENGIFELDDDLLRTRNSVAHGKYEIMRRDEFIELHRQIIKLMELFLNQITNAALTKAYKRTSK